MFLFKDMHGEKLKVGTACRQLNQERTCLCVPAHNEDEKLLAILVPGHQPFSHSIWLSNKWPSYFVTQYVYTTS